VEALKDNEKYKVVWQVLQALRAHDDRFNSTINQIELNKKRPDNIQVIGVSGGAADDGGKPTDEKRKVREHASPYDFPNLDEWKDAIYAKMVMKVGDRAYWETWARDIATIAERHITRTKALIDDPKSKHTKAFDEFLAGLQANLNPAVTRDDAIEMLAQHLITGPVFDALFGNSKFTKMNPVSQSMQKMLDLLQEQSIGKEAETLEKFYQAVRGKVEGVDNAEARQSIIKTLYDEFFNKAFPRMAKRLGIVYTPVEVVDFIIHSVQDVLRDEFNSGLGEEDVHIIDPFTGTGTFIVRLLQSGLIPPEKLLHKYQHELHANEIVLLAYYIAAINIEETFHSLRAATDKDEYLPFDGIVLTDTFQLYESAQQAFEGSFPENSARVKRQKASPIRVVIANPPYSVNDNPVPYPALDAKIEETYVAKSTATNKNSLYDSYIRAIRWASDRIKGRGIVSFVSNGSYIDGNAADGLRACLTEEFTSIYVFNLRGNQRTSGELSRQEGGKIFDSGSRAPIAITVLVKNPEKTAPASLQYYDIGDYLNREDKLKIISGFAGINGIASAKKWTTLHPNTEHDWINQRDDAFDAFIPINDGTGSIFSMRTNGVQTNRDDWVYNFGVDRLSANMRGLMDTFNEQVQKNGTELRQATDAEVPSIVTQDAKRIKWSRGLYRLAKNGIKITFSEDSQRDVVYRPFTKRRLYLAPELIEYVNQWTRLMPKSLKPSVRNFVIMATGVGAEKAFSALIVDTIPDLELISKGNCFPLYLYEKADESAELNFDESDRIDGYRRRDAITDAILKSFHSAYGSKVTKEDIFYYVYGVLHSPEYRTRFAADLKKMLPRIPFTKETEDFWRFSQAGRDLAHWHLNYETVDPWLIVEHRATFDYEPWELFKVVKMSFARPTAEQKEAGLKWDKTQIIYNSQVTLSGIPLEAYDYVVNGKPAIEWVKDRYEVTVDKDSGIKNDPNDWCREHNQPRYIVDLIGRVIRVSMETNKIVSSLPALNEMTTSP
jgi:predicted helicase